MDDWTPDHTRRLIALLLILAGLIIGAPVWFGL
jgi:hypothetical protein